MISVYIESKDHITENRICYVMTQLLIPIGFPFTFHLKSGDFSIACIPKNALENNYNNRKFDLIIPYDEYDLWLRDDVNIKVDKVEGIHVLYIDEMPKYLIHNGKIGFDLINIVFYLLSRQEEYIYKHRDLWDCFSATYSTLYENGILGVPVINYYIKHIRTYIQQKIRQPSEPMWKNGASCAVILSHDVDRLLPKYISITLNRMLKARKNLDAFSIFMSSIKEFLSISESKSSKWDLSDWTDKEDELGFRSTFFLAANTKDRHVDDPSYWINSKLIYEGKKMALCDVAKIIENEGWEIGLHGSMNSYRDQELLSKERDLLINQTGCSVFGIRQHYLRFDVNKTWRIYESLGFGYDTTLGFNERNGFRAGIALPFYPYDMQNNREYNLIELPMSIMDGNFFSNISEKLDYNKSVQRFNTLINHVLQTGGLLVINFHPHYRNYPDWWALYEYILNYLAKSSAWVATGKEVFSWWSERRKRLCVI